jgi:hypothetical protein
MYKENGGTVFRNDDSRVLAELRFETGSCPASQLRELYYVMLQINIRTHHGHNKILHFPQHLVAGFERGYGRVAVIPAQVFTCPTQTEKP